MGALDDLRAIRESVAREPKHFRLKSALTDLLDVLIAEREKDEPGYLVIGAPGSATNGHQVGDEVTVIPLIKPEQSETDAREPCPECCGHVGWCTECPEKSAPEPESLGDAIRRETRVIGSALDDQAMLDLAAQADALTAERDELGAAFDDLTESWRQARRTADAIQQATRERAEKAEAERDEWKMLAHRERERAEKAEAALERVRALAVDWQRTQARNREALRNGTFVVGDVPGPGDILALLDAPYGGKPGTYCGRGPCCLGDGHDGECKR